MIAAFCTLYSSKSQCMEANIGQKFGRLIITQLFSIPSVKNANHQVRMALCRCDCGNDHVTKLGYITAGKTSSCGCLKRELQTTHGKAGHPVLKIRNAVLMRCYNQKNAEFHNYGGRGITVCDEWRYDAKAFIDWALANGWRSGLSIDRIDVNGNYAPSNCRWVTSAVQGSNRRDNIYIEIDGVSKTMSQWSRFYGISRYRIRYQVMRAKRDLAYVLVNKNTSQS